MDFSIGSIRVVMWSIATEDPTDGLALSVCQRHRKELAAGCDRVSYDSVNPAQLVESWMSGWPFAYRKSDLGSASLQLPQAGPTQSTWDRDQITRTKRQLWIELEYVFWNISHTYELQRFAAWSSQNRFNRRQNPARLLHGSLTGRMHTPDQGRFDGGLELSYFDPLVPSLA